MRTRLPCLSAVSRIVRKVCIPVCTPSVIDLLTDIGHLEHDGYSTYISGPLPSNLQYGYITRDAHATDSLRSRHSPRLRGKAFAKSAVGFTDQFAFLNSQQTNSSPYRPFPGLVDIIQQRSQTANAFACREPSPLTLCTDETRTNDPFSLSPHQDRCGSVPAALLVPDIMFVPDARVLDSGYHNFWVAIEVSARLHRPEHGRRDSSQCMTPESQRSSRSVELGQLKGILVLSLSFDEKE